MPLPVDALTFRPVVDMPLGTIFRQRDVWHLKAHRQESDQDIVVVLTGPRAGQWFHASAMPKMECLALELGMWRAEFAGLDQVTQANAPELALGLSTSGAAVHAEIESEWTWAGLDGKDHTTAFTRSNFQTWIKSWSVVAVDAATNSTTHLFDVIAPQE